jgi:hypothetical protein
VQERRPASRRHGPRKNLKHGTKGSVLESRLQRFINKSHTTGGGHTGERAAGKSVSSRPDPSSISGRSTFRFLKPLASGAVQNISLPPRLRPCRILHELLVISEKHLLRVPSLASNTRDRSGDLLCRDERRLRDERAPPGRASRRLSDVNSEA